MKEILGDLFKQEADAICITTNGYVKTNGKAVMGAGVALTASRRWPEFPIQLGSGIRLYGNIVLVFKFGNQLVITFPVKHQWFEKADLDLIKQSAIELVATADRLNLNSIILPRPGCGNGGLNWYEVKPILEPLLDDRFSIISLA